MKRKQLKFVVGSVVIILTLSYLAYSGYQESKAITDRAGTLCDEGRQFMKGVCKCPETWFRARLSATARLSNSRSARNRNSLQVRYVGKDPLPDTLRRPRPGGRRRQVRT